MGTTRVYVDELEGKYGPEHAHRTAAFLNHWQRNYRRAAFIDTGRGNPERYARYARDMATRYGWKYERLAGGLSLMKKLLTANERTADILVVPPGGVISLDAGGARLSAGETK